jgi:hypothetical protein
VEYRGAIHIHSRYSDGTGSMKSIIAAARGAGLDFIVITDHDTLRAKRDGWEGWHEGVLVLVGVEITSSGGGHCLALDVRHCAGYRTMPPARYLDYIGGQGGLAILAHPMGKKPLFSRKRIEVWEDWDLNTFAGMEVWSYMHDWISDVKVRTLLRAVRRPEERIVGPEPEILKRLDALGRQRRVAAIAGLDAHAPRLPLTWVRVFSYGNLFRTLRTHVLAPSFVGRFEEDKTRLREAIEQGRCFIANDLLADSTGFAFCGQTANGELLPMGSEVPWKPGIQVVVSSPRKAMLRLVRDGEQVLSQETQKLTAHAESPGVYRAEAFLDGQAWIFSNPLYLRPCI